MKIALRTDGPPRAWHRRLGERLAGEGHALWIERVPTRHPMPSALRLLLAAERYLYRVGAQLFVPAAMPLRVEAEVCELVLEPRFDGMVGESALVAALLARNAPHVEIRDVSGDASRVLSAGLPAVERPGVLASALDMVLARTIQLVEKAVWAARREVVPPVTAGLVGRRGAASPLAFFVRTLTANVIDRIGGRRAREGWRVAIRRADVPDMSSSQAWSADHLSWVPNDGRSFRADPFLFTHDGLTCIFYEEFPYATRKGVIGMVELGPDGLASPPRRVLEHDVHLSYPFVFAHQGAVYMLPEMGAAGRVQLFRADPFPSRWVPDRVLIDGVVAADATLVAHEGRWWLFATLSGDGGSSWDALCLFHAPDPLGPWTSHSGNPVLVDAGVARPAGAMWHEAGTLMRVAQDCRDRYGGGLAICRVDRLDLDDFAQTVVARLGPPAGLGAERVHTLNRAYGWEVIDVDVSSRYAFPEGIPSSRQLLPHRSMVEDRDEGDAADRVAD